MSELASGDLTIGVRFDRKCVMKRPESEIETINRMEINYGAENREFSIKEPATLASLESQMKYEFGGCEEMTCKYDILNLC